jgi:hypothetical protein
LLAPGYVWCPNPGAVSLSDKQADTVGQPPNADICMVNMSSLKAKKLRKLSQEKVLLEL